MSNKAKTVATIREDFCKAYKSILPTLSNFHNVKELREAVEKQRVHYKELSENFETAELRRSARIISNVMNDISAETFFCDTIEEVMLKCAISIAYNDITDFLASGPITASVSKQETV